MSASLLRARRPFFVGNLITGIAIASFGVGVWAYSISAVKQDVFDDVDEQARALNASSNDPPPTPSETLPSSVVAGNASSALPLSETNLEPGPRGLVFAAVGRKLPWLFEPTHKTLVWGAPPVDDVGRINEKILVQWRK